MVAMATVTMPIVAKFNGKDIDLGELTIDVKMVGSRVKAPTEREIKAALRKALR